MCGIIAVISKENRSDLGALVAYGLYQEQNRGDFSAGIATIKKLPYTRQEYRRLREQAVGNKIKTFDPMVLIKNEGKVNEVFGKKEIEKLSGFMGIGQVRYPTAGYTEKPEHENMNEEEKIKMRKESIQPLPAYRNNIAMIHNGDIHNYHELMDHFEKKGLPRAGNNDLEAVLNVFTEEFFALSEHIKNPERLERTLKALYDRVDGTYSAVAMLNNVGIVAFRDREGRRPLLFGVARDENNNITDYAFASETSALQKMLFKGTSDKKYNTGKQEYDEVKPGEMIFISKDFEFHRKQIVKADPKPCPFEGAYFLRASSFINEKRVKNIREEVITHMWERFKQTPAYENILQQMHDTIVVPVPRTANASAEYLSVISGIKFDSAIEKNAYSPRIFQQPTQTHRVKQTIADHFIFDERVRNKNILLIDDSIVRGTTMHQIVKYLKDVGSRDIHLFIAFPEIRHPCMHAIDFHTEQELIAHGKTLEEIKSEIGLKPHETLMFATPEEIAKSNKYKIGKMCDECYRP